MPAGALSCGKRMPSVRRWADRNEDRFALIPIEKEAGGIEVEVEGSREAP